MTRAGLPYAEETPLPEVFADAAELSEAYPISRLPQQQMVDRLAAEARWLEISEEISAHGSLSRPFID